MFFKSFVLWTVLAAILAISVATSQASAHSNYLYVWSGDVDKAQGDKDFLATIDIRVGSGTFGQVIATTPVTEVGTMPHHNEYTV